MDSVAAHRQLNVHGTVVAPRRLAHEVVIRAGKDEIGPIGVGVPDGGGVVEVGVPAVLRVHGQDDPGGRPPVQAIGRHAPDLPALPDAGGELRPNERAPGIEVADVLGVGGVLADDRVPESHVVGVADLARGRPSVQRLEAESVGGRVDPGSGSGDPVLQHRHPVSSEILVTLLRRGVGIDEHASRSRRNRDVVLFGAPKLKGAHDGLAPVNPVVRFGVADDSVGELILRLTVVHGVIPHPVFSLVLHDGTGIGYANRFPGTIRVGYEVPLPGLLRRVHSQPDAVPGCDEQVVDEELFLRSDVDDGSVRGRVSVTGQETQEQQWKRTEVRPAHDFTCTRLLEALGGRHRPV